MDIVNSKDNKFIRTLECIEDINQYIRRGEGRGVPFSDTKLSNIKKHYQHIFEEVEREENERKERVLRKQDEEQHKQKERNETLMETRRGQGASAISEQSTRFPNQDDGDAAKRNCKQKIIV